MTAEKFLVTGATGRTGRHTVQHRLEKGHAVRALVKAVVNMSQISAREDSKSHAARDHWIAEAISGVLARTITYRPSTIETYRERLKNMAERSSWSNISAPLPSIIRTASSQAKTR